MFRQPSGSDEGADAITLHCSPKWLRVGSIRSPAALPRMAVRGRAFLSEYVDDNRSRYDKGGQRRAAPCPPNRSGKFGCPAIGGSRSKVERFSSRLLSQTVAATCWSVTSSAYLQATDVN